MTGTHAGLYWTLDYTAPISYTLSNDNGVYSQGIYTDFVTTAGMANTSTSTGIFTDSTLGAIINVSSVGSYEGSYDGAPIEWIGTGTFTFLKGALFAVPIPAAAFLFAPALLGFMGLHRKAKNAVA
jgi:hypothetical protein